MDPKRKRIYIILIVVCVVLSIGILVWSNSGNPAATPVGTTPGTGIGASDLTNPAGIGSIGTVSNGYALPAVFPARTVFDTSVLDLQAFKALTEYNPIDINGQIGRDNPFKGY